MDHHQRNGSQSHPPPIQFGMANMSADIRERPIKSVPEPAMHKPSDAEFYMLDGMGNHKPNAEYLRNHFFREGRITDEQALFILQQASEMLQAEPNVVDVRSPVTICGDIHGQYYDLMKLFEVGGTINENCYLFLGDYVDRGCFGIECLLYLYTLKLWHPKAFTLIRGNHECRHLTEYFTFKRECLHKYSPEVYEACIRSFCMLPVAAIVDGRFFCVHGGISPELHTLEQLMQLNRFREPGSDGLLCDLLWSDPIVNYGHEQEASAHGPGLPVGTTFIPNPTRGCSYYFTYEAACQFLERNSLLGIIRGHEAQDAGYTMHRKTPTKKFPSVITIFSAPNYLDVYHNRGAVLKYANKNITIRQYNSSPHPYWLPNFMDAFTWSLPFVGSKITEMLLAILSICSEEELGDSDSDEESKLSKEVPVSPTEVAARRQQIKNKILAVGRMQRVFQLLREEAENASELNTTEMPGVSASDARKGRESLSVQSSRPSINSFAEARRSDIINERLPTYPPQYPSTNPSSPNSSPNSASPGVGMFPVPSMRIPGRPTTPDGDAMNMEYLIKRTLEEEEDGEGIVERLAERIARTRKVTARPGALKRFDTAY